MRALSFKIVQITITLFSLINIAFVGFTFFFFENNVNYFICASIIQLTLTLSFIIAKYFNNQLNLYYENINIAQISMSNNLEKFEQNIESKFFNLSQELINEKTTALKHIEHFISEKFQETNTNFNKIKELILKLDIANKDLSDNIEKLKQDELISFEKLNNNNQDISNELISFKDIELENSKNITINLGVIVNEILVLKNEEADVAQKYNSYLKKINDEITILKNDETTRFEGEIASFLAMTKAFEGITNELNTIKNHDLEIAQKVDVSLEKISNEVTIFKNDEALHFENEIASFLAMTKAFEGITNELNVIKNYDLEIAKKFNTSLEKISDEMIIFKNDEALHFENEIASFLSITKAFEGITNELDAIKNHDLEIAQKFNTSLEKISDEVLILKNDDVELAKSINSEFINSNSKFITNIKTLELFITELISKTQTESINIKKEISTKLQELATDLIKTNSLNIKNSQELSKIVEIKMKLQELIENRSSDKEENAKNTANVQEFINSKATLLNNSLKWELSSIYERIDSLLSIHQLISLKSPLPVMNDWTISSDYGNFLLKTILAKGEGSVIDIGSGISTIISGYAIQKRGLDKERVISLEHDKRYYEKTKILIAEHKLENYIELYYCPLVENNINNTKWLWYDISKIIFPKNITVISVDGPPGNTQELSRYPAVPMLIAHINSNTTILLDDGKRDDEQKIAKKWELECGFNIEFNKSHKGFFICHLK